MAVKNVVVSIVNDELTLKIDLTKNLGPSSSGKTEMIGTSSGNQPIPGKDGYFWGLNVFKKEKKG
jgi:hypothetical protein